MKPEDILVVYKRSTYENYLRHKNAKSMGELFSNSEEMEKIMESHESHMQTMNLMRRIFPRGQLVYRANLSREIVNSYSFVLAVGGDGTLLETSHYVCKTPVMLVNSDCRKEIYASEGAYAGATRLDFEEKLEDILAGRMNITKLNRLEASIDGKIIQVPVLNEVLVADSSPAAMSYYTIDVDGRKEFQKSSGVWIATAAGSTAAISSAGGKPMPLRSKKMQYLVREPYSGRLQRPSMVSGIVGKVEIISEMRTGMIYMDGHHEKYNLGRGCRLILKSSGNPLSLVNLDEGRRDMLIKRLK